MINKIYKLFSISMVLIVVFGLAACQAPAAAPAAAEQAPAAAPAAAAPADTQAPAAPAEEAKVAPAEKRSLTIWHYESDTGAMGKAWNAAVEEFKKTHPDVDVVVDSTRGFEQIRQTASMVLNSDQAPDVMEYNKGNATSGLLSSQGLLTDMTDEVTKRGWDKILTGGMQTTSRYENGVMGSGKWYGVTNYGEFVMVFYNKDLFKKYDLSVPTTMDEFEKVMATFKAAGITPIATSAAEYPAQQVFYELALSQAKDSTFIDNFQLYKSPVDFSGPEFTYAAEKMVDWVNKGYIEKNSTSLKAEDMGLGFEGGKYPMMISGSWWYGRFMEEIKDFDWGIFLFPGNKYNPGSGGNLWIVPTNSKNKDLAYDFIDITMSQPIQTILANSGGIAVNADVSQVTDPKIKELTEAFAEFSPGAAFYPDWPAAGFYDALVGDVQELINGTKTPAEVLKMMDEFYQQNKPQ